MRASREGKGRRVAVKVGERSWTYDEVLARANRASFALRRAGVGLEDRVLLLLPDGIEFVDAFFGVVKAGAVFCMGNPLVTEDDMEYLLRYTKARAVVAHASTLDRLAPALAKHPRCAARFVVGGQLLRDSPSGKRRSPPSRRTRTERGHVPRRRGGLALHQRHHRQAQGRGALPPRLPVEHRALRQGRTRPPGGRRLCQRVTALLWLRHGHEPHVSLRRGRHRGALPRETCARCALRSHRTARRHRAHERARHDSPDGRLAALGESVERAHVSLRRRGPACPNSMRAGRSAGRRRRSSTASAPPSSSTSTSPTALAT
jgi:hypothetical protein